MHSGLDSPLSVHDTGKPLTALWIGLLDGETDGAEHGLHIPRFGVYLALGRKGQVSRT